MKKILQYNESLPLSLNVFLVFYLYVTILLIIANILPVSGTSYLMFFLFGIMATYFLFIKASYKITIHENILEVSVTFLIRVVLKRIDLKAVRSVSQLKNDTNRERSFAIERSAARISYVTHSTTAVKLTMLNNDQYIISTNRPLQLVSLIASLDE